MNFAALSQRVDLMSGPYKRRIAEDDAFWSGSPFDWIRRLPSRTRGSIGQQLSRDIFEDCGHSTSKRKNSFEVNGVRVISRSSMLWEGDHWKFQQVRDTPFDYLFCLGLYPDSAFAWFIPKGELYVGSDLCDRAGWGHQHGGRSGKEDAWLEVYPNEIPDWLAPFGGEVSRISGVLEKSLN